jgi:dethiobiotin synthase
MKGYFVTGTDTGVGKTLATVALTRALVARGLRVAVMKPVAAGTMKTPEGEFNDDALDLLAASNVKANYEDVNPWLLQTPASPHLAARLEGVSIRHERIIGAYLRLAKDADVLLAEGAGGWLAPISATETMADVAERLAGGGTEAGLPQSRAADTRWNPGARSGIQWLDRESPARRNALRQRQYRHAHHALWNATAGCDPGGDRP